MGVACRRGTGRCVCDLNVRTIALDTSWHKSLGDTAHPWLADGTPVALRVVALLKPGLGGDSVVLSSPNARQALARLIYVRLQPATDRMASTAALLAASSAADATVRPVGSWTAGVTGRQAHQTRLGLTVLLAMATLYSALNIANTLVMSTSARRRELNLLRLLGATRAQVLRMIAGETLLLAGIGVSLAAALSTIIMAGVTAAARSLVRTAPLVVPWTISGLLAASCVALAVVAASTAGTVILRGRCTELTAAGE